MPFVNSFSNCRTLLVLFHKNIFGLTDIYIMLVGGNGEVCTKVKNIGVITINSSLSYSGRNLYNIGFFLSTIKVVNKAQCSPKVILSVIEYPWFKTGISTTHEKV